jgi:hypothetical protein
MVLAHAFAFTPLLACARTRTRESQTHLRSYISLLDTELGSVSGADRDQAQRKGFSHCPNLPCVCHAPPLREGHVDG